MNLGEKVKERREELGMTQDDLARKMGYSSRSSVNKIENGRAVSQKIIAKLADALNVSEPYLMGFVDSPDIILANDVPDLSFIKKIPLLGSTACGYPTEAIREYDYVEIDLASKADFCLRAEGRSMTGCGILDGSLVLLQETNEVENGQIAAITVDNATTIKKFYKYGNTVILRPCNPDYEDQEYSGEDLNHIHVFGRVIACLNQY